uniref:hypothetical protein n=1 Tax=Serratia proteamaculans TaxID=28151 RepID=UPI0036F40038
MRFSFTSPCNFASTSRSLALIAAWVSATKNIMNTVLSNSRNVIHWAPAAA